MVEVTTRKVYKQKENSLIVNEWCFRGSKLWDLAEAREARALIAV